jgi:hypothetical protein
MAVMTMVPVAMPTTMPNLLDLADLALGNRRCR